MEYLLVMVLLCGTVAVMASPLIRRKGVAAGDGAEETALEAAKEAKFREIRDAELDFRMGKLSREDYRSVDNLLRAEAIELLRELDSLRGRRANA